MKIESIKTSEDAIAFAKEEFQRRKIDWNIYELDFVLEVTDEIAKQTNDRKIGWDVDFILKVPEGFETRYLFLHIYPSLGTCEIVQHC
jgi:hypothetical protein